MDFLIRRKVLISMFFVAMTMLGLVSYNNCKWSCTLPETPSMVVMVGTNIEVDPEYMENQAIIPVEGAIGTLEEWKNFLDGQRAKRNHSNYLQ
jgi:multidrug efflux pump subunit AcrB